MTSHSLNSTETVHISPVNGHYFIDGHKCHLNHLAVLERTPVITELHRKKGIQPYGDPIFIHDKYHICHALPALNINN